MNQYKKFLLKQERIQKENSDRLSNEALAKLREKIPEIVKKYPTVKKIVVFGSVVTRSMNTVSDVDIFVDTVTPSGYWDLMRDFSKYLGRDIDLLTPDDDPYFISIVLKKGLTLYERKA